MECDLMVACTSILTSYPVSPSNDRAAETLCRLAQDGLEHAILAHLSDKNNQPHLARRTCRGNLNRLGFPDLRLTVAEQDRPSAVFAV